MHRIPMFILLVFLPCTTATAAYPWIPLTHGASLEAWTTIQGDPITRGWQIEGGVLEMDPTVKRGGNILSKREFGNFELVFEWRSSVKGNSGIKYRVKSFDGRILGCEYQMLDDSAFPDSPADRLTASLYDVYDRRSGTTLNPPGEFNHGRIVVCGNRIQHWLNGCLVVDACVGSSEWNKNIADSKFSDVDGFGRNHSGYIMLTDHNSQIAFRNVYVRELPSRSTSSKFRIFRRFRR